MTTQLNPASVDALINMAESLLEAVRAHNGYAPDPHCDAIDQFIAHLIYCDLSAGFQALSDALDKPVETRAHGFVLSPSESLVHMLLLAAGSPNFLPDLARRAHRCPATLKRAITLSNRGGAA